MKVFLILDDKQTYAPHSKFETSSQFWPRIKSGTSSIEFQSKFWKTFIDFNMRTVLETANSFKKDPCKLVNNAAYSNSLEKVDFYRTL